ncbi:MAG: ClbS/DfsB family four-helix bundle protein [Treponema sp.]|jgi:hypothetical protein|nr:ClbS/DfsB family four-helix bundle protein [Treponema sp.]
MNKEYTFDEIHTLEQNIVNDVINFYNQNIDFSKIIYTDWTAKDVLAHINTWHESFAKNVFDIVNGNKLNSLKGRIDEINENGVKKYKNNTIDELINKLKNSQEIIDENIKMEIIKGIPYKKGSRNYTPKEHLEIVYKHIKGHLNDIYKKYK